MFIERRFHVTPCQGESVEIDRQRAVVPPQRHPRPHVLACRVVTASYRLTWSIRQTGANFQGYEPNTPLPLDSILPNKLP
ncbi:hypothetical protein J6590_003545 [Homalodisca vitripennis]|nr:hypothetical protein J6590_003545 [Homalodisca vitripennis]